MMTESITMTERISLSRKIGQAVTDMSGNTRIKKIIIAISGLILIAVVAVFMWFRGAFLPRWITWKNKETVYSDKAEILLKRKHLSVNLKGGGDSGTVWESEDEWLVSDCLVGDIDHDDEDEIILLVWKRGSYGRFKPIWVEEDDKSWSQHIFIYDFIDERDDRLKPIWMSSEMGIEASDIKLDEEEALHIITPEGKDTVWYWQSWGLMLVDG